MRAWRAILTADVARDLRSGNWWLPVAFFLLVALLFPFGVGPDVRLLAATGGGMVWVAALLATLLPLDQIFSRDAASGALDQYALHALSEEGLVLTKILSHLVSFGLPLFIAAIPAAALLGLGEARWGGLLCSLAIGLPGLSALGVTIAAVTLGQRSHGALSALLLLPLAVPILIFGAGSLSDAGQSAIYYLAACSLSALAIAPFAAGAALRAAREN
ncbi:MAG: heme exporter protein CcmB [Sphingomonadaceae bacterium]|nr:heme exporter protein CcmB [Sphingomonadaceae bacterium]